MSPAAVGSTAGLSPPSASTIGAFSPFSALSNASFSGSLSSELLASRDKKGMEAVLEILFEKLKKKSRHFYVGHFSQNFILLTTDLI